MSQANKSIELSLTYLKEVIHDIEAKLRSYYPLVLELHASEFLIDDQTLQSFIKQMKKNSKIDDKNQHRAGVWMFQEECLDELFLALYFSQDIVETIYEQSPKESLSNHNLDAYMVLVEEVSHFHLINQRCATNRQTSMLELEWQAEIDKVLITADLLQQQCGDPHLEALVHKSFYQSSITHQISAYQEANRFAAIFWQDALAAGLGRHINLDDKPFKAFLQDYYLKNTQEKYSSTRQKQVLRLKKNK